MLRTPADIPAAPLGPVPPARRTGSDNGGVHTDNSATPDAVTPDVAAPDVRTLSSGVVYADAWIRLRKDEIEFRDGSRGSYAFVEKPDFALVIPAEGGGFHLVEEYRYPIGRRSWSFPQGGFPPDASGTPEELAALELAQETGLRAGQLVLLGRLSTAHGMSSQYGYNFLATGLTAGDPEREAEEQDMRHAWVDRAEFEQMTRDGRIVDDSTLAAYALLLVAERQGEVQLP
jgi:8-oxo-dGTP pyrophosphatase MutT (NUDIX family)